MMMMLLWAECCSHWKIDLSEGFEALEVVVAVERYILPAPHHLSHQRVKNQHEAHDPSLHSCSGSAPRTRRHLYLQIRRSRIL